MKRLIITTITSLIVIYIVHLSLFGNTFTHETVSNAFFVVGIVMFFFSLIAITDATKLFLIFSYGYKSVRKRKNFQYKSYYDYMSAREKKNITPYSIQVFVLSILYLLASLVLAYIELSNRVL